MKNSEISTLLIPRNKRIETNIDTAMVTLDSWNHVVGSLVMIKYYTESHDIDTLVAIGVDDGAGRDKYSIISTKELYVVNKVLYDEPVDVSQLVNNQRYLCKYDNDWKILILTSTGYRTFVDIPRDLHIFRNLADGFQYFYVNGELKREDAFITTEEINVTLKKLEESLEPPKISQFEVVGGTLYPNGSTVSNLQVNLSVLDYKNEDIIDQFEVKLYKNGGLDEVAIEKINNNSYKIYEDITVTTTYTLKVIGDEITLDYPFTITLVDYTFYGKMKEYNPNLAFGLERRLWDGIGEFEFMENLDNDITILAVPTNLTNQFTSIKDTHGLNYIKDYDISPYEYNGKYYTIYHKKDQVIITDFKQIFGHE